MMRSVRFVHIIALVVACSGSILSSQAFAFDGRRKGFILGFGAGAGTMDGGAVNSGQTMDGTDPARGLELPRPGVQTDLKIGLGVNDRVLIYYTGKQSWPTKGSTIGAFPMLGMSYYLSPDQSSLFISGGLGAGLVAVFDIDNSGPSSVGAAVYAGAGYEFARHYYLEFDVVQRPNAENVSATNLALTLNALAF